MKVLAEFHGHKKSQVKHFFEHIGGLQQSEMSVIGLTHYLMMS